MSVFATLATPGKADDSRPSVVSINLCADQLVLLLADDEQIQSLSNLSHEPAGSYYYERAREFPVNTGLAEEIVPLSPSVVIAGQYAQDYSIQLLRELGQRVEVLPIANSIEELIVNLESVGKWLGQGPRASASIDQIRQQLRALPAARPNPPLAVFYDPNGFTVGAQTLRGQLLELAGWKNLAADLGISHYGSLPLEALVMQQPDAIIESPYSPGTFSRAQRLTQHSALRKSALDAVLVSVPGNATICAGPWSVDVIQTLVAARLALDGEAAK